MRVITSFLRRCEAALPVTALQTARRERDAERRLRRQLAALHEVSLALSALSCRDELCRQAVELGRARLGFDRLGLWLQLEEPGVITGTFGTDERGQTRDERGLRLPIHVLPLAAQLLDGSARVLRRDGATLFGDHGNPVGQGTHVLAGLWDGRAFIGFLAADNLLSGRPIPEGESELLGLYAAAIGHLCIRLRAEAALQESWDAERHFHQQIAALHDVSLELSTAPDIDTLCRRAVELGRSRLGFDRLGLWFRTDRPDQVRGSFGTDRTGQTLDERGVVMPVFPGTPTDRVLSGQERVSRREDTLLFTWQSDEEERGTQVVAGLWNGQQAIGYLSADNRLWRRPITERQSALLELYAAALGHLCTLKQREAALQEADRRKDQALAMLAHELRNPLAPIQNAVELLKQKLLPIPSSVSDKDALLPELQYGIRNTLAVIERQVWQQAHLLDDLLDLARLGQRKIELRRSRLDLVRLVRDAAEDHRGVLAAAGVALILDLPERPRWADGDAARLTQVMGNLLANAAKFTPAGGQVVVGVQEVGGSGVITVTDTGIGIEAEMLPRVFDAFTQADRARARSGEGLGLGLALVRGLVERHGGEVRADSNGPGRGARFTITLPLLDAGAWDLDCRPAERPEPASLRLPTHPIFQTPPLAQPVPGTRHPKSNLQNAIRVLIIEDDQDAAETLRELLELFGCAVVVARSGMEGIETAPRFGPEVVLCDLRLPGLDGCGVAAALRGLPEMAHTRLIAVSGADGEELRRALEAGFDLHLTKPIDFEALRQLLEVEHVNNRQN